jgi:hypothetical protein
VKDCNICGREVYSFYRLVFYVLKQRRETEVIICENCHDKGGVHNGVFEDQ